MIDKKSKVLVSLIYDDLWIFSEGLGGVSKEDKCGFIDKTGTEVIPLIYDHVGYEGFREELCWVQKDGKYGFIGEK